MPLHPIEHGIIAHQRSTLHSIADGITRIAGISAGGAAELTWTANPTAVTTGNTTHTYSGVAIGPDQAKVVVVAIATRMAQDNRTIASATIGGSAANIIVQDTDSSGTPRNIACIFARAVAGGTTADITFTSSAGNISSSQISVFYMTGRSDTTANNTVTQELVDPTVANLNVPNNGCALVVGGTNINTTGTMVGVATEDRDSQAATHTMVCGHENFTTGNAALSVGVDWAADTGNEVMAAASWAPA